MRYRRILALAVLALVGCNSSLSVDNKLHKSFIEMSKIILEECPNVRVPTHLALEYGTTEDFDISTVAITSSWGAYKAIINFDPVYWNRFKEEERNVVMAHELMHAIFKYKHEYEVFPHFMNENVERLSRETLDKQYRELIRKECTN